jgi:hypothetical protein
MVPGTPHPFADVLNVYMRHVVRNFHPEPAMHEELEKTIHSFIVNLQQENTSESNIYKLVAEMNSDLGDPLAFYEEFVIQFNESYKNAAKVQKKVEKEAAASSAQALTVLTNNRKCHKLEQATHNKQSKTSQLTTPSLKMQANQALLDITPGSYVIVKLDLLPGMCLYRQGTGFVMDVNGDGVLWTFTVKYYKSGSSRGKTEASIQYMLQKH